MNAVKKSILKRLTSFMMAVSMTGSVLMIDGQPVFALDSQSKVTVLNNDEHGRFEFVSNENYIDVLKEVSASELNLMSEETESSNEVVSNEEALNEELAVIVNEDGELETVEVDKSSKEDVTTDSEEITAESNTTVQVVDPDSKIISKGETVVLNAIADEGYSVESIYVTEEDGDAVRYTFKDNTLSFVMPNEDVTIKSKFSTDVVDVNVDDSVVDNFTYIRSNLNPEYVSLNKWDVADIIYVKNLLVNKKVFDDNGYDVTIDNFNDNDVLYGAMLNFRTNYALIYDVDANSNYYVSYINFAQNDEEAKVYDYTFARMNDNGEALGGCYFDKNTGIAYIKKSIIDNETIAEGLDEIISTTQIELLIGYDDKEVTHSINVNVEDLTGNVELQSGVIETSLYDNKFEFKLAENYDNIAELKDAKINVVANELSILNGDESDLASYDSSTGVLTVTYDAAMLNNVNIYVEDSDSNAFDSILSVNAAYTSWASVYSAKTNGPQVDIDGGTTNFNSYEDSYMGWMNSNGTIYAGKNGINPGTYTTLQSTGQTWKSNYITKDDATKQARDAHTVINSYNNLDYKSISGAYNWIGYASNAGVSDSSGTASNNALITNINNIFSYELSSSTNLSIDNVPVNINNTVTRNGSTFRITMPSDGKDSNGNNVTGMHTFRFFKNGNSIGYLKFGNNTKEDNFALQCAHPGNATVSLTNSSIQNYYTHFWLNILKVDATNRKIVYGMVSRADTPTASNTQIGVGVFVSSYSPDDGTFTMEKGYSGKALATSAWTGDFYDLSGAKYALYYDVEYDSNHLTLDTSKDILVATLKSNSDGVFKAADTWVKHDNTGIWAYTSKADSSGKVKISGLPYGRYIIRETAAPKGFKKSGIDNAKTFTSSSHSWNYTMSNTDQNGNVDFPTTFAFRATKTGGSVAGAKYKLYYSNKLYDEANMLKVVNDSNYFKVEDSRSVDVKLGNHTDFKLVAYYEVNSNGRLEITDLTHFHTIISTAYKTAVGLKNSTASDKLTLPYIYTTDAGVQTLYGCPLGYYYLVEYEAPTNKAYTCEIKNGKPTIYVLDAHDYTLDRRSDLSKFTNINLNDTNTDTGVYQNKVKRFKYEFNGSAYVKNSSTAEVMSGANTGSDSSSRNTVIFTAIDKIGIKATKNYNQDSLATDKRNALFTNFPTWYKKKNAKYSIYANSNGTNLIATGTTDDDGKVKFTIGDYGKNNGYYVADSGYTLAGFSPDTTIYVKETAANTGGYMVSDGLKSFTVTTSDNTINSPVTNNNGVKTVNATVYKAVELNENSKLYPGSKVTVRAADTGGSTNTHIEVKAGENTLSDLQDYNPNYTYYMYDVYATGDDVDRYFTGTTIELWYNAFNKASWPTTKRVKTDDKYKKVDVTPNANYSTVKVGQFVYEKVKIDGVFRAVPKATVNTFYTYKSNTASTSNRIGTYTGTVISPDSSNGLGYAEVSSSIKDLPLGYYQFIETKSTTNTESNVQIPVTYKSEFERISSTSDYKTAVYSNRPTITNDDNTDDVPTVDLYLFKHNTSMKYDSRLNGAKYVVWWSPTDLNLTTEETESLRNTSIDEPNSYLFGGNSTNPKMYKVGEFLTAIESGESYAHGYVVNNAFSGVWYENGSVQSSGPASTMISKLNGLSQIENLYVYHKQKEFKTATCGLTSIDSSKLNSYTDAGANRFVGPKGYYLVVETKAPTGYGLDPTVYTKSLLEDGAELASFSSEEKEAFDPLNINIIKTNDQDNTSEYSLAGTRFTLNFYSDVDIEDINDFDNSTDVSARLVFEVDEDNIIDLETDDYLIKDKSTNYESYVNRLGKISFPSGLFIIKETQPAPGYKISKDDHFTVKIDNTTYDLGNTLYVKLVDSVKYIYTTDGWKEYDDEATLNVSIPNTAGEPFKFTKYYADNSGIETTRFKLTQYKSDKTTKVREPWVFTVTTDEEYNSATDPVFESVDGNPLIVGAYYTLEEIDDNGHYIRKGSFTYKSGMSVNKMLGEIILGDVNDDGKIDIKDTALLGQYLADWDVNINLIAADVNADGKINTKDITYLQRFLAGWTDNLSLDFNKIINYSEPKLSTIAWDPNTKSHISYYNGTVKITDTVNVSDVVTGNIYIVEGIAVDVTNPDSPKLIKDANGKYIVGSTAFLATGNDKLTDAIVNVEYEFAGNQATLAGKTINFYEYLVLANINEEDELNGILQENDDGTSKPMYDKKAYRYTDYIFGEIPTAPVLEETTINAASSEGNIAENETVTLYMAKDTTNVITNPETQITTNTVRINGLIKKIDGSAVSHADAKDEGQNIYFPSISTTESDVYTLSHVSGLHPLYSEEDDSSDTYFAVFDTVTIKNLKSGDYILTVSVCDQDTHEVLDSYDQNIISNGNATQTFTTNNVIFKDDVKRFYITEELYTTDGKLIAIHNDSSVASQQGYIASIGTRAQNKLDNSKLVLAGSQATITDTVSYTNLVTTNHDYYLQGYLVDKSNDKIIATAKKSFNNGTNTNGSQNIDFTFNATGLDGKTLVVYEFLYWNNTGNTLVFNVGDTFNEKTMFTSANANMILASHYDNGDANQTVYIPKLSTEISGDKKVDPKASVTITDNVFYENVLANQKYTIYGYLVDRKNTATESDDTLVATSRKVETLTSASGTISMSFTFDATKFLDRDIVVYEYMYLGEVTSTFNPTVDAIFNKSGVPQAIGNNRLVGQHADSTDAKQTIHVNGLYVDFLKVDPDGNHIAGAVFRLRNLTTNTTVATWTTTTNIESQQLSTGDYILEEIDAPDGKTEADSIKFTVRESEDTLKVFYTGTNTELTHTTDSDGSVHYSVNMVDVDLTRLPDAGGIGTTAFTISGLILMLGGVYIANKKKKKLDF